MSKINRRAKPKSAEQHDAHVSAWRERRLFKLIERWGPAIRDAPFNEADRSAVTPIRSETLRTAARNMIRAGVPQSVAMRVTGHVTDAMFHRYDITDNRDKLAALVDARRFVDLEPG